ncbi:MAG: alanine--glyoxylate aminotransferase family protein [Anaerovoracaceae bacterium]
MYKIMTPGPVQVRENVRMARSLEATNPDLDPKFFDFYRVVCNKLAKIMDSSQEVFVLGGEGILGLEAACASLTEPGDRVLVIDNGIFGRGFGDFVAMYGGQEVYFKSDYKNPIEKTALDSFLKKDSNFKYATLVHMDTPSGVLNNVEELCKLLKSYGILTVVDTVAGMFGEEISVDKGQIDILCAGSQKALSAPPGLTMMSVSKNAFESMVKRKTRIAAFYANLLMYRDYYTKKAFPYTMPASDINGLSVALDNVLAEPKIIERHKKIARATRNALVAGGIELFLQSGFSNNVTAFCVPQGVTDTEILTRIRDVYGIMIAGSLEELEGQVIRIGHMGENSNPKEMAETLEALTKTLDDLGVPVKCNLKDEFLKNL